MKKTFVKPQCGKVNEVRYVELRKRITDIPISLEAGEEEGQYFITLDLRKQGGELAKYEYRSTPEKAGWDGLKCILSNFLVTIEDGREFSALELMEMGYLPFPSLGSHGLIQVGL